MSIATATFFSFVLGDLLLCVFSSPTTCSAFTSLQHSPSPKIVLRANLIEQPFTQEFEKNRDKGKEAFGNQLEKIICLYGAVYSF